MTLYQCLKKILGWRDWGVFTYNAFIENIFIVFYIGLSLQNFSTSFLLSILCFYLFSIFSTSYGFLINDLGDRELDLQHAKPNTFHNVSNTTASVVVGLAFLGSVIFAIPFVMAKGFIFIWAVWLFATTFYSLEPLRLKEKGFWGLAVVVIAQRLLPTLLIFSAFQYPIIMDIILISAYVFMRGLASDLNHQIEDFNLDANTATTTFAVSRGISGTERIFNIVLEVERLMLTIVLLRMGLVLNKVYQTSFHPVWLLFIGFLPVYVAALIQVFRNQISNPFAIKKSIFQFIHHAIPSVIVPLYLCLLMALHNIFYGLAIVLFALNKRLFQKETWVNSYPVLVLKKLTTSSKIDSIRSNK